MQVNLEKKTTFLLIGLEFRGQHQLTNFRLMEDRLRIEGR